MANDHLSEGERRLLAKFQGDAIQKRLREQGALYGQPRPRRAPRMPRVPEPKPGSIAAVIRELEQCSPETAAERAMLWAQELIEPNEVRTWEQAGLNTYDLPRIIDFRQLGVPPEAMGWKVRGETMLEKIRTHRYSPQAVTQTLRTAGLLIRKSA